MTRRPVSLLALLVLFLPWSVAAEPAPGEHRVERPAEPASLIELRLDRGLLLGEFRGKEPADGNVAPVILHLYRRGKAITSGWAMAEALGGCGKARSREDNEVLSVPLSLDTRGLICEGGSISGTVIRMHIKNARAWEAEHWKIDAAIAGTAVTGTFECTPAGKPNRGGGAGYAGKVSGRVIAGDAWEARAAANRVKAGADWPCWLGPTSNGRAVPADTELVARWEDARLAWRAEVDLVPGSPGSGHPDGGTRHDYNGPVVADGKVFLFVMEPAVDGPMYNGWPKDGFRSEIEQEQRGEQQARWILASLVDDVGYCFDAATGALLWRTVFPRRGASGNFVMKGKGGHWSSPVVGDGRVYWCGSNSRVYCVDASTGEPLWERVLVPGVAESFDGSVKRFIADKRDKGLPYNQKLCSHLQASPCLAGGVLICPAKDQLGGRKGSGSGLYGLDPATGAVLWGPIPPLRDHGSPFRWHQGGRDYVLTPEVRCIDPRSGKELWSWKGLSGLVFCGAVAGDRYLPRASGKSIKGEHTEPRSAGPILRLDATGATVVGAIPVSMTGASTVPGVGATCDEDGHFFYCQAPGKENRPDLRKLSGIYVCDRDGKLVAQCTGNGFKHFMGYGSMIFSNGRIFVPGNCGGISMFTWDSKGKQLEYAEHLAINYYWCSTPAMADGRLFFRTNEGLVCYDMRRQR